MDTLVGIMASCEKFEVEWDNLVRAKNRASPMLVQVQDCDCDSKMPNRKARVVFVEEQLGKVELNTARMLSQGHWLGLEHRRMEHTVHACHRYVHRRQVQVHMRQVQVHWRQVLVVGYGRCCDLNCRFLATGGSVVGRGCRQRACIPLLIDCFSFCSCVAITFSTIDEGQFGLLWSSGLMFCGEVPNLLLICQICSSSFS